MEYEMLGTMDATVQLLKLDPSGSCHGEPFELSRSETVLRIRLQHALF